MYWISPKFIFKFNFWSAISVHHFLFLTVKFTDLSLKTSGTAKKKYQANPSDSKKCNKSMKFLGSFFSYIIYYKILIVFS